MYSYPTSYPNGYQQYQPTYQPMYQSQPVPRPTGLVGKQVTNPNDITVQDVPTDGSIGWFPLADGSAVIGKRWNANGTIDQVIYTPQQPQQPTKDPLEVLTEKVDAILAAVTPQEEPKPATRRRGNQDA